MSDDRVVRYDKSETVWNYARILSKFPNTMLSESLIFKKKSNTDNCTEKEPNTDSSYINYLEKRVFNLHTYLYVGDCVSYISCLFGLQSEILKRENHRYRNVTL